MDYELIKTAVLVLNMLMTVSLAGVSVVERRQRASLRGLEKRLDEKCLRLDRMEGEFKNFSKRSELIRVHERMDVLIKEINSSSRDSNMLLGEISGQLKQMSIRIDQIGAISSKSMHARSRRCDSETIVCRWPRIFGISISQKRISA